MASYERPSRRALRLPIPLAAFLLLSLFSTLPALAAPSCLRFADYNVINQAFIDGGPGTKVFLCPSKSYRLTGTIVFTAADQELATYGYPTGSQRATLLVNGDFATAVQGDCRRCARVTITNLIIDGNRGKLGRIVDSTLSTGLVVIGGNEGQTIKHNLLRDPRGFTAVHVREGDKLQCKGATIENNEIGPVGEEFVPAIDGPDPELSPLGRPLADGISIACRDSVVKQNEFYDNTDAAIVLYCSPGTVVNANAISTRTMSAMAGILMVDSTPFDGDYSGVIVKGNMIEAAKRIIRVGIGIGSAVWSDDTETVLKGGSVLANGIRGRHMGYGIAAIGLDGWTIKDNWDEAVHSGERSARCFDEPINPNPVDFLYNSKLVKNSEIQPGFVDQPFEYVVCIDGAHTTIEDKHPALPALEVTEATVVPESKEEEQAPAEIQPAVQEGYKTGSEVMDDILEHSQARMLEAIDGLSRRVDVLSASARRVNSQDVKIGGQVVMSPQIANALSDLQNRIAGIEARQKAMMDIAASMRSALKSWDLEMSSLSEWQYEVLLDVQHRLNLHHKSPHAHDPVHAEHVHLHQGHEHTITDRSWMTSRLLSDRTRLISGLGGSKSSWATPIRWVIVQSVFLAVIVVLRSCLRSKRRDKLL